MSYDEDLMAMNEQKKKMRNEDCVDKEADSDAWIGGLILLVAIIGLIIKGVK